MNNIQKTTAALLLCLAASVGAQAQQTDTARRSTLGEVTIQDRKAEGISRISGAENGQQIGQDELFRAACCNLGESFLANPAVDVNYNDAATGARQIKLLGLSGTYVQMLAESLPMSGGASQPYLLGYVPGAWMKSISVSKGASSVKNGPQSITGQINVEYLKPEDEPQLSLNLYADSRQKAEGNAMANLHLNKHLSTELLLHYERDLAHHDADGDQWHDSPNVTNLHLMNRWKYAKGRYIMHAGLGYLNDEREGGQLIKNLSNPFRILIGSQRAEAYMKHAYLLNREHNTNVALLATASHYNIVAEFGDVDHHQLWVDTYTDRQLQGAAQLVLEHDFDEDNSLSTGLSMNYDKMRESVGLTTEATPGLYAQYTYKPSYKFTGMVGLRADRSNLWGLYVTPRLHLKWIPTDRLTLRASAGKGYRTAHFWAENHYLLSSGRMVLSASDYYATPTAATSDYTAQEEAWNTGISAALYLPVGKHSVTLNAEYYYTNFINQLVADFDSDPLKVIVGQLEGSSYSHTAQVDATYEPSEQWSFMAAMRYNRVMCTYGGVLREKPLQSRYKALLTTSWKPMMGIWQLDVTFVLNGGGRMPTPYTLPDGSPSWQSEFKAFPQLNMQLTREFRHFAVYLGGENLTNYRQPNMVINAADPYSTTFEPTMIWGPVHGIMGYAGVRADL